MSVPVSTDWKVPHIEYADELSATKLQRMSANMSKAHGAASLPQEVRRLRRVGNLRHRRTTPAAVRALVHHQRLTWGLRGGGCSSLQPGSSPDFFWRGASAQPVCSVPGTETLP